MERSVNIYDPADDIRYVHMARQVDPYAIPLGSGRTCTKLPTGYANGSPRTRLSSRRPSQRLILVSSALLPSDEAAAAQRN